MITVPCPRDIGNWNGFRIGFVLYVHALLMHQAPMRSSTHLSCSFDLLVKRWALIQMLAVSTAPMPGLGTALPSQQFSLFHDGSRFAVIVQSKWNLL